MPAIDLVNLSALLDDAKCFALVRQHRWPEGVRCPGCGSEAVIRNGCDDTQPHRQRYRCRCKACAGRFDDLTGTALAGHHQPLRVWVVCLSFMGLNLSNRQIALELELSASLTCLISDLSRAIPSSRPNPWPSKMECGALRGQTPRPSTHNCGGLDRNGWRKSPKSLGELPRNRGAD